MTFWNKLIHWYFSKNALPYWAVLLLDCFICYFSGIFVFWLYYRGAVTLGNFEIISRTILLYMVFSLIGFKVFRTYSGIIRYSSFRDLVRVGRAMTLSCILALIAHYPIYHLGVSFVRLQGRQIIAMYIIATIVMWAVRILVKIIYEVSFESWQSTNTLIYGVKDGGVCIAKHINNETPTRFKLKGFISNTDDFRNHLLMGVKVYRVDDSLRDIIHRYKIKSVLVSPMQNKVFRSDEHLQDMLIEEGIKIFMYSETHEWKPGDTLSANALKEIKVEDLLPRNEIEVDMKSVGELLRGKKILITGSAGSIGNEILKQVSGYHPAELVLIDIAETPQNDVKLMMKERFPDIKTKIVVGSIANRKRMENIFASFRPDYVFHAAR